MPSVFDLLIIMNIWNVHVQRDDEYAGVSLIPGLVLFVENILNATRC